MWLGITLAWTARAVVLPPKPSGPMPRAFTSARTSLSVRGINIWGIAEVFTDDTPEFAYTIKLFDPIIKSMAKAMDGPVEIPKGIVRAIRITPAKMVYHHNSNGIKNAYWVAD